MSSDEMIEFYLEWIVESKNGLNILFTDGADEIWLPKSIIRYEKVKGASKDYKVEVPEWKAIQEGMV